MKIGYLTACLPKKSLEYKMQLARDLGFDAVEVSCWPRLNTRDYSSSDIDVKILTQDEADEIVGKAAEYGLIISALAYYDNNLSADPEMRAFINQHSRDVIKAAGMLKVPYVGVFIGRDITLSIEDNFPAFQTVFTDLTAYAAAHNVGLMIENCPMVGWQQTGTPGTISFTPELWREMFERVPAANFGLNYDPSHMLIQGLDYIAPIYEFKDRIFHAHAKDSEIAPDQVAKIGFRNFQLKKNRPNTFWNYRMPGLGQINFPEFVKALKVVGYEGVLSIEHEDLDFHATEELIVKGLKLGIDYLRFVDEATDAMLNG